MADTELQIAARQASDQKQAVLRQQSVVLGLKKEGGPRLDKATELLESMRGYCNSRRQASLKSRRGSIPLIDSGTNSLFGER